MNIQKEVLALIDETLSLGGRTSGFTAATPLLGAIPELDSMAVVALITSMEERFGIIAEDDEIDGSVFMTVGSFASFLEAKLSG